jgi:hypothetical protein
VPDVPTTPSTPPKIHFPPLVNGVDFLDSTSELLAEHGANTSPRKLRYAVVHLAAALESILKARLEMADPAYTWWTPKEYNEAKHKIGDFKSVGWLGALERITEHCSPTTDVISRRHVGALANMRNRIAHFGLTDTVAAVEVLTTPVLDFLLTFTRTDVIPPATDPHEARRAREALEEMLPRLGSIKGLVAQRLAAAEGLLKERDVVRVLFCPVCTAHAVPLESGEDKKFECLVCETDFGPLDEAIAVYAGTDEYEAVTGGDEYPVWPHESLFCNGEAVYVPAGETVDGAGTAILVCLTCGEECAGFCDYCQRAVDSFAIPEADMCCDCMNIKMARF